MLYTPQNDVQILDSSLGGWILVVVLGLVLPFALIPVVAVAGYSEFFEESIKLLVVFFVVLALPLRMRIVAAMCFGFLFGVSEALMYSAGSIGSTGTSVFLERVVTTAPMHACTVVIMTWFGMYQRELTFIGFVLGTIVHVLFNMSVQFW